jgi:large subunit ribosomal protein L13
MAASAPATLVAKPTAAWRPGPKATHDRRSLLSRSQAAALCALFAAAVAGWTSFEAFVRGPLERPAGRLVVVDELPSGLVCRNSWKTPQREGANHPLRTSPFKPTPPPKQEAWFPVTQWRGEKTYHANLALQADANRQWYHFDAEGKVLGRLAQAISNTLRGKHSPLYDPIRDVGAFVVVTNCEKVMVSGKKYHYKLYLRNLVDRPGGMRVERFKDLQKRFPERIIMKAVWGSMPKRPSQRRIFKERLKLFRGPNHLYYHHNPIQYPMHLIKDCTAEQNLRPSDRITVFLKKIGKQAAYKKKANAEKQDAFKLEMYKKFLKKQFSEEGDEAAKRMSIDELVMSAEKQRFSEVVEANIGLEVKKPEVKMIIPGSNIPKVKYSGNRPRSAR